MPRITVSLTQQEFDRLMKQVPFMRIKVKEGKIQPGNVGSWYLSVFLKQCTDDELRQMLPTRMQYFGGQEPDRIDDTQIPFDMPPQEERPPERDTGVPQKKYAVGG